MLHVFRKHQKWLYILVTIMICVSFSFFGVMNSISGPETPDPTAFTTISGKEVPRSELDRMAYFIGTDDYDKMSFGGIWGPNFLNDGVIAQDFLSTGLAQEVSKAFADQLRKELQSRSSKEANFTLYSHPEVQFINVENAWNYLAPEMKKYFSVLQSTDDPLSSEAFDARVNLYLAQRQLPPFALKRVLTYQQQQYNWIPKDPNLESADLSVFGYHTADDWFGPTFLRLAAALIIDISEMAQSQGIQVSDDEALASLLKNAHRSFEQNKNSPRMNVKDVNEYLKEQLRRMRMDLYQAVSVWRQVLLFRSYFQEYGDTMIVDRLPYQSFAQYASEFVAGDLYQLPEELRLSNFRDLQQYEYYISAITDRSGIDDPLQVSDQYLTAQEIAEHHPSFVQRRYRLNAAMVDSRDLENEVGTKQMWDWQLESQNWQALEGKFPDLGVAAAEERKHRFETLESLTPETRNQVDKFSRKMMTEEHPEWIDKKLDEAEVQSRIVGLRRGGSESPFEGISDPARFIALLDASFDGDEEAREALKKYSDDGKHYYRITVLEAAPDDDVLTFAELKRDGTLDAALRNVLQNHYEAIRGESPEKYQTANGEWKAFREVRDLVAKDYFHDVLIAINDKVKSDDPLTVDDAARYRFSEWMKAVKSDIEHNPENDKWVRESDADVYDLNLSSRPHLSEQWKLIRTPYKLTLAGERDERIDRVKAFSLDRGEWSDIYIPPQGDITFFRLQDKGVENDQALIQQGMAQAHQSLSHNAQQVLMRKTLEEISAKQPIELKTQMSANETPG